jgi:four helix bundle protein
MDYRDLVAWQKAMGLAEQVYRQTAAYPVHERYGLTSQMRRSATSIPSNIAEGQGRRSSDQELVRFLQIAHGSLCELQTQLELSVRLKLISNDRAADLRENGEEVGRLLGGLIRAKSQ